jgi:maltose O-acetyltransferase
MPGEKERMLRGEPYDPTDPELVAERERARAHRTVQPVGGERARTARADPVGAVRNRRRRGPRRAAFRCDYGYNVHVGDGFFANFDCVVLDVCPVEFGDRCLLGPGVHVYTATHPLDAEERAEGLESGDRSPSATTSGSADARSSTPA